MRLRTSRHFFQLIGLSFLILSVSSIINFDIAFAFSFLVYTIFLTWTLVYTHITQQVESSAHPDAVAAKASKFVTGKFLLGSSALGLGLLTFSLTVFVLFPRVSLGYFTPAKKGETVQGFSDTIDLGHFGTLGNSEKIILRLEFLSGKDNVNPETALYLRGMSFDRFDGREWSKSKDKKSPLSFIEVTPKQYRFVFDGYDKHMKLNKNMKNLLFIINEESKKNKRISIQNLTWCGGGITIIYDYQRLLNKI